MHNIEQEDLIYIQSTKPSTKQTLKTPHAYLELRTLKPLQNGVHHACLKFTV